MAGLSPDSARLVPEQGFDVEATGVHDAGLGAIRRSWLPDERVVR